RSIPPPTDLLERFLETRTDAGLLKFARRYGPLVPTFSNSEGFDPDNSHRESITKIWRRFQWEFGCLLGMAAALRENSTFDDDPQDRFEQHAIQVEGRVLLTDFG